ncbi:hypothetical protein J6590_075821 [Homalodisca vitripennis]|nr:hypothetical protein J6590_075821 [Homalodisca vitripennis]
MDIILLQRESQPDEKRVPVRPTHHIREPGHRQRPPPRPNDDRCSSTPAVCDLANRPAATAGPNNSHPRRPNQQTRRANRWRIEADTPSWPGTEPPRRLFTVFSMSVSVTVCITKSVSVVKSLSFTNGVPLSSMVEASCDPTSEKNALNSSATPFTLFRFNSPSKFFKYFVIGKESFFVRLPAISLTVSQKTLGLFDDELIFSL